MPKIKNIIIFTVIFALLILAYVLFFNKDKEEKNLVSAPVSSGDATSPNDSTLEQNSLITKDFLSILLNVKNIKLESSIFSEKAFINLRDSSILLTPSGDEGRSNPFAPIGYETGVRPETSE
jgi:hypothetical protein